MIPPKYWSPTKKLMVLGAMAGGKTVEDTATGNPLTFQTDLARPLKSLLIPFTPQQEGTGDPSPQNIRSILPWNGLTVFGGGKNILNPAYFAESSEFYSVGNGVITAKKSDYRSWSSLPKMFLKAGTYTIKKSTAEGLMVVRSSLNDYSSSVVYAEGVASGKFTLASDAYIAIKPSENMQYPATFTLQLEVGQTATAYEPYAPITETSISFPFTVYGGTLDVVSGVLTVEWRKIVKTWGEFTNKTSLGDNTMGTFNISSYPSKPSSEAVDAKCNIAPRGTGWSTDSIHFYTNEGSCVVFLPNDTDASTEIEVVYPLATPQEIQLTPAQITALKGNNTIWSDADGSMTVVFLKKG